MLCGIRGRFCYGLHARHRNEIFDGEGGGAGRGRRAGKLMTSPNAHNLPGAAQDSWDLKGVNILLVEDSWHLGIALKNLLKAWGADVSGPVATAAEADRLTSEHRPAVALVDLNLRGGERAYDLIDRLHERGIPVIVTSGYEVLPRPPGKAVAVLQKPFGEAQLLALLRPLTAQKAAE
jgi:CheY-like chemotaxis protein